MMVLGNFFCAYITENLEQRFSSTVELRPNVHNEIYRLGRPERRSNL
jgi:hypothetical protein